MNVAPEKIIWLVSPSTSVFLSKAKCENILISSLATSKEIHFTLIVFGSKEMQLNLANN